MNRSPISSKALTALWATGLLALAGCKTSTPPPDVPETPAQPQSLEDPNASLPGQEWRNERPALKPPPEMKLPTFEKAVLPNGLTVLVSREASLPLVSFSLVTRGGSATDPRGRDGLTALAYDLIGEGAGDKDALQFSDAIADLGASFGSGADQDGGYVSISGLSREAEPMLALLADAALRPRLSKRDFDRVKNQALGNIMRRAGSPQGLAFEKVPAMIYGGRHPYGHPVSGTKLTVSRITSSDVKQHLSRVLAPGTSALIVVGDIDLATAKSMAKKHFGKWKGRTKSAPKIPTVKPSPRKSIAIINKAKAPQTMVVLGRPIFGRGHQDGPALTLANQVFGGAFTSRLNMNLREDKGFTYGARSVTSTRRGVGALLAYSLVRADATGPSLFETFKEIADITANPPTEEEVSLAKEGLILSLPGDFETTGAAASAARDIFVYELPLTYFREWPSRLESTSLDAVHAAAEKYITGDNMKVILVGDAPLIESQAGELELGELKIEEPK